MGIFVNIAGFGYSVEALEGRLFVDLGSGRKETDWFIDHDARRVLVANPGPEQFFANLAYAISAAWRESTAYAASFALPTPPPARVAVFSGCFLVHLRHPKKLDGRWVGAQQVKRKSPPAPSESPIQETFRATD